MEGRKFDECESFVVDNDLNENPQVNAVLDAAKHAYDNANDICEEEEASSLLLTEGHQQNNDQDDVNPGTFTILVVIIVKMNFLS